jgi:Immunity protein 8
MMPELRSLESPDVQDLRSPDFADPEYFSVLVEALIGEKGGEGEDVFSFIVCSPKWIAHFVNREKFLFGMDHLIVSRWDYALIWDVIGSLCRRTTGSTWSEVANRLNRYAGWEFEDDVPYQGSADP